MDMDLLMFIHFGVTTFNGYGHGWESDPVDPSIIDPPNFSPRQWARVAHENGFGGLIFTAKHHNGLSFWPTEYSDFDISLTPYQDGNGDFVAEVAEACQSEGVEFGVYLSPMDWHEPTYGTPAYNDFFDSQLRELLTNYGPVFETWFDGARDEGNTMVYEWNRFEETLRTLQPGIVTGIDGSRTDNRWCGNEQGMSEETQWGPRDNAGIWQNAECAVSIRPSWFWMPREDDEVKTLAELLDIYFLTRGRNSMLLLGFPPTSEGVIAEPDIARMQELRAALDEIFEEDLAAFKEATASNTRSAEREWAPSQALDPRPQTFWATDDELTTAEFEVDLGKGETFNVIEIKEPIRFGQRVSRHRVEAWIDGGWVSIASGTTVGYDRMYRIDPTTTTKVRLVIEEARSNPAIERFSLYYHPLIEPYDSMR